MIKKLQIQAEAKKGLRNHFRQSEGKNLEDLRRLSESEVWCNYLTLQSLTNQF